MRPTRDQWKSMIGRCQSDSYTGYENYGGRGIKVCEDFLSYSKFAEYVDSLPFPDLEGRVSLDRIDNDGDYEPGNLRWADMRIQNRNRRWVKLTAEDVSVIKRRINDGEHCRDISADYPVGQKAIEKIKRRVNWADVPANMS